MLCTRESERGYLDPSAELSVWYGKCKTRDAKRSCWSWRMQGKTCFILQTSFLLAWYFLFSWSFSMGEATLQIADQDLYPYWDHWFSVLHSWAQDYCLRSSWCWGIDPLILSPGALLDFSNYVGSWQVGTGWYNYSARDSFLPVGVVCY